ncbi:(S)-ureidoglycine aminohydrolase, partial [Salmonella enterica subsp. enterica serovar Enteritidis]
MLFPGVENCDVTILATPKRGASFVDYQVSLLLNGGNQQGGGGEGIESFLYVITGNNEAIADGKPFSLTLGGYHYCPPGEMM